MIIVMTAVSPATLPAPQHQLSQMLLSFRQHLRPALTQYP